MSTQADVDRRLAHLREQLLRADNGPALQYVTAVWQSIQQVRATGMNETDIMSDVNKLLQQVSIFMLNPTQQIPEQEQEALNEYYKTIASAKVNTEDIPPPMEGNHVGGIQAADIKAAAEGREPRTGDLSLPSLDELEDVIMDMLDEEDSSSKPRNTYSDFKSNSTTENEIGGGLWAQRAENQISLEKESHSSEDKPANKTAEKHLEEEEQVENEENEESEEKEEMISPNMNGPIHPTHMVTGVEELSDDDCIYLTDHPKSIDVPGTVPSDDLPMQSSESLNPPTTQDDDNTRNDVTEKSNSPPPKKGCCTIM